MISIVAFVGGTSFVFFKILDAFKLLRSDPAHELQGLDIPEMGVLGYPVDWEPAGDVVIYGRSGKVASPLSAATD